MYKILKKGSFESFSKFEERLNDMALQGWRLVSVYAEQHRSVAVFERKTEHR